MFVYKIWIYVVRNLYKIFSCFLKIIKKKRYFSNSFYHYSWSFQLNLIILVQTVDMNRLIFQNSSFLKTICNATRFHRSLMIEFITTDQILTLSEIARKVIRRRVHISNSLKEKLTRTNVGFDTWHTLNSIQYGKTNITHFSRHVKLFSGNHIAESFGQTSNILFETRGSTSNVSIRGRWWHCCEFEDFSKQMRVPFVIYCDFEAFARKLDTCLPDPSRSNTTMTVNYEACGYGYTSLIFQIMIKTIRYMIHPMTKRRDSLRMKQGECRSTNSSVCPAKCIQSSMDVWNKRGPKELWNL